MAKNTSARRKAVVIGTGIGGAGCAGLLAKAGFEVTVLEGNKFTGGRTATSYKDGFALDMGVHVSGSGPKGPCGEINRRIGGNLQWASRDPLFKIVRGDRYHMVAQNMLKMGELYAFSRAIGVKTRNIPGAVKAFGTLSFAHTPEEVEPYDDIPLLDLLHRYTDDEEFIRLMETYCGMLICVAAEEASAGEFIWCFSRFTHTASCSYPTGGQGFARIPRSYLEVVERLGGSVHTSARVKRIVVEDGRVTGVETSDRFYPADVVASNAGIKKTVEMVGESEFDSGYVSKVASLKDSMTSITIKYALDTKMADAPITLQYDTDTDIRKYRDDLEEGVVDGPPPVVFMPAPSFMDPAVAPPGREVLLAGTIAPSNPKAAGTVRTLLDLFHKKVMDLVPGLEEHTVIKQETDPAWIAALSGHATGDIVGVAQICGQVGRNKPNPAMPIKGLYLVGCDAGGRGIGTEQAADSALNVSDLIVRSESA